MQGNTLFIDPRFATRTNQPAAKNPSPRQLAARWAHRAQRATEIQTKGVWHSKVTSRGIWQQMN